MDRKKWNALWHEIGAKRGGRNVYAVLKALYAGGQPLRAYHNVVHIRHCLEQFREVRHCAKEPAAVETAIWFHDAIYNPRWRDNELHSAMFAERVLSYAGIHPAFIKRVEELIMATRHRETPTDADAMMLCDIDLSPLGASDKAFDKNSHLIRKEYSWLKEDEFFLKQAAFLKKFLERPSVFTTAFFREKYERQAHRNIERFAWRAAMVAI